MTIDVSLPGDDWRQARVLALMSTLIYQQNWVEVMGNAARDNWGMPQAHLIREGNGTVPRIASFYYPSTLVLVVEGTTSRQQGIELARGYFEPLEAAVIPAHLNHFLLFCVDDGILSYLTEQQSRRQNLLLTGHSLGGAIAQTAAFVAKRTGNWANVSYCTFGSPMAGSQVVQDGLANTPGMRVMCDGDPIPWIVPTPSQAPLFYFALPPGFRDWTRGFRHAGPGQAFSEPNRMRPAYQCALPDGISEFDLASLMWSVTEGGVAEHLSLYYYLAVDAYVKTLPEDVPVRVRRDLREEEPPAIQGPMLPPKPAQIQQALRDRYVNNAASNPQTKKNKIFLAVKSCRSWGVTMYGTWICWGMRRHNATHMAFLGNEMMDRFLKAPVTYPNAFVQATQNTMDAAQDPSSGITPQLQTEPLKIRRTRG